MTLQADTTVLSGAESPYIWERQARPAMESLAALDGSPARAVVIGNAGSGKSTMLRELQRLLLDKDADAVLFGDAVEPSRVPSSHVLLVDDLHLLASGQVAQLRARSENPDAALVVASRPWPRLDALTGITRTLERSRPAIVLGHVSRSDVLTYLDETGQQMAASCLDYLLTCTGGVSWLVSEALALHDERDCAEDASHSAMIRDMQERIAHRLDSVPLPLRAAVEAMCVSPRTHRPAADGEIIAQGYAEGLLMRNGQPVPIVRTAVRATIPVGRLIDFSAGLTDGAVLASVGDDAGYRDWIGGIHDPAIGTALRQHADRVLENDPRRALELYAGALECGLDPAEVVGGQAHAAWATGDLALASTLLDGVRDLGAAADRDRIADTSAAIWSMRGMMRMSDAAYRSLPPIDAAAHARATIAAVGAGQPLPPSRECDTSGLPSTLCVSLGLLDRGIRATLGAEGAEGAVADLVHASEMYTSSGSAGPIPELPAVVAAIVSINIGDLDVARTVIEDALSGGQGGAWARARLLLWRSWLAVQRARPEEAREALAEASSTSPHLSARDNMLAQTIRVAIARRYEDAAALEAAWLHARDSLLHTEADLYLLQPLAELLTAAARLDDTARLRGHLGQAIEIVERLGSPPVWSTHLRWAGIQQGILLNRPESLEPHARALVAAAPHSPVAAVMAQAGRVWTATLAGAVDADAVEAASHGLASAGLGWDGARLAGYGASRTTDRKVAARLLSCARELHPVEVVRKAVRPDDEDQPSASHTAERILLSERERDVARLVLQGKTYAEIGETIFISPRTAEHHIAHIRRRLGATSRSDLLAKLRVVVDETARPGGSHSPDRGAG